MNSDGVKNRDSVAVKKRRGKNGWRNEWNDGGIEPKMNGGLDGRTEGREDCNTQ